MNASSFVFLITEIPGSRPLIETVKIERRMDNGSFLIRPLGDDAEFIVHGDRLSVGLPKWWS